MTEQRLDQALLLDWSSGRDGFALRSPELQEVAEHLCCRKVTEALKKAPWLFLEESAGIRPSVRECVERGAIGYIRRHSATHLRF